MVIHRGEIWWVDFPDPVGSGPGFHRPVVIVQADRFNRWSGLNTVIGVLCTTNLRLAGIPGNVLLSPDESGLPRESVALMNQVVAFDRSLLTDYVGKLGHRAMSKIDDGLRLWLDLD